MRPIFLPWMKSALSGPAGLGQRMGQRGQRRMHADRDPLGRLQRARHQLDAIAEVLGQADVDRLDRRDPLDLGGGVGRCAAERQRGQDGDLVRGVEAADVHGRVGLGVAKPLGFRQHVGERPAGRLHLGQDVVAGAVEDAGHRLDLVADHGLAQHLHRRRPAHHRGLEQQGRAGRLGQSRELCAVLGDQRLVGGDDRLAGFQRGLDRDLGRAVRAADQLDEDVVVRGRGQGDGVVEPGQVGDVHRPRAAARPGRDAGHDRLAAHGRKAWAFADQVQQAAADGAEAGDADAPGVVLGHGRTT